ncbi:MULTISPECIES: type IV toxin-antitoxin system AbiEi family antitoxin domain-containing protein [Microbacterium]|uniref:type IV toxin-antitoxin system AbiEi family antitoxin domain-containing protein n=1 Tax=Microbacterium TaxID=33882 RepID=UPI00277FF487|nr:MULTISPECIES: type IV toxin-antitoxin system AbiEi family antitoxin domain-containing protein [Microbacterium]MDQ1083218.1 very-short-patch-repair endonuclease [Microbacterium sp. SORGH_AS_0344]MDQ1171504.1 very-short-patch-repair endonuclease [Microbacterium proteolyticum]
MASLAPASDGPLIVWTTATLREAGMTRRAIGAAVESGALHRVRRGRYLAGQSHPDVIAAARCGGRLDCVSLVSLVGVFVHRRAGLHVQQEEGASRRPAAPPDVRYHWRSSTAPPDSAVTALIEALAQSVRCQAPRSAVATLDSAWHLGFVDEDGLGQIFARLPRRYQVLRGLLEGRSESGPESLVRLLLRTLGCHVDVQVRIDGVGRVDFLVDGWLIVECDSERFHGDWQSHKRDRRRDSAALERGFCTVRLLAEDILYRPDAVRASLERILGRGRRAELRRSQADARRARRARAQSALFSGVRPTSVGRHKA